jgi:hypothetical protein
MMKNQKNNFLINGSSKTNHLFYDTKRTSNKSILFIKWIIYTNNIIIMYKNTLYTFFEKRLGVFKNVMFVT